MFTLAHELAHIWIGEDALVNMPELQPGNHEIEKFCNRVAAEFLVPEVKLREAWPEVEGAESPFRSLASRFKASPIVIARCAKDLRLISADEFFRFYYAYLKDLTRLKISRKGGGDFYRTQNSRLGRRFGRAVIVAAEMGRLSYQEAYDLTYLHGATFDKYAAFLRKQEGE
jgi:Zn-dependent peptidase ImmA (M78 family)